MGNARQIDQWALRERLDFADDRGVESN